MNLFLDTCVLLAACGSPNGASRFVFDAAAANGWRLLTSEYVLQEVAVNLPLLPESAATTWAYLRSTLEEVADVVTFEWATVFAPAKDRPILLTAAAWADVLLSLDGRDFGDLNWMCGTTTSCKPHRVNDGADHLQQPLDVPR